MKTQLAEEKRPQTVIVKEKETPQDEEPPLPKPRSFIIVAMRTLADGWLKMMDQGVAV